MVAKQDLEKAADAVERWLAAVDADDSELAEADFEELWDVSALARAGASESEIGVAVRRAHHGGWSWSPIAKLLCLSRREAISRYSTPLPERSSPVEESTVRIPSARESADRLARV